MMRGPYMNVNQHNRQASASSSLVSCANFANKTLSRLDLVEKDYAEWNTMQANRERLLQYKSELLKINSSLYEIDCREAQLTASLNRRYRKDDAGVDIKYTHGKAAHYGASRRPPMVGTSSRRPVFVVSSRRKPVLIHPNSSQRSVVKSSYGSLVGLDGHYRPSHESPSAQGIGKHCLDGFPQTLEKRQLQSSRFHEYLSDTIDRKVDRALDDKLRALMKQQGGCLRGCTSSCATKDDLIEHHNATTEQDAVVAKEIASHLASLDSAENASSPALDVAPMDKGGEVEVVADTVEVVEKVTTDCSAEEEVRAVADVPCPIVTTSTSATQTRYSSFAPSHVKQKRIGHTAESQRVRQKVNSPYVSHDELTRLAQRLSSTSLISHAPVRNIPVGGRFESDADICCCENKRQHVQNCPSYTSLPLHTLQRARPVRLHRPSPLSLEFKHRRSVVPPPLDHQRVPGAESEASLPSKPVQRRRAKQDSSVSLGIKMTSGHAFDTEQKFRTSPLAIKSRVGRGKLRKLLFGI